MWSHPYGRFMAGVGMLVLVLAVAVAGCGGETAIAATGAGSADSVAFRDAVTPPDSGWTGPVFKLSADYPESEPTPCSLLVCPWLALPVDFAQPGWTGWALYMESVKLYATAGQTVDLDDSTGWRTVVNGETRWFHVPWMAYDPVRGREFVHGTTNERTATLSDFVVQDARGRSRVEPRVRVGINSLPRSEGPDSLFETWAVGMYNGYGAYALGQAVPRDGVPVAGTVQGKLAIPVRFPVGTVVIKLLFTTATVGQVPYLAGSPVWTVDRHVEVKPDSFSNVRHPQPVRLVQVDLAVRDNRSPVGWVYGTYAYDGKKTATSVWDRLSLVGVQWGSDPNTFPAVPQDSSAPISESILSPDIGVPQHNGCNGRLAGPVDNRRSSCTSCHGGAYAPWPPNEAPEALPPIFGFGSECMAADATNRAYFTNASAFPNPLPPYPGVTGSFVNLDTSLQLLVAYRSYSNWLRASDAAARSRP